MADKYEDLIVSSAIGFGNIDRTHILGEAAFEGVANASIPVVSPIGDTTADDVATADDVEGWDDLAISHECDRERVAGATKIQKTSAVAEPSKPVKETSAMKGSDSHSSESGVSTS